MRFVGVSHVVNQPLAPTLSNHVSHTIGLNYHHNELHGIAAHPESLVSDD